MGKITQFDAPTLVSEKKEKTISFLNNRRRYVANNSDILYYQVYDLEKNEFLWIYAWGLNNGDLYQTQIFFAFINNLLLILCAYSRE